MPEFIRAVLFPNRDYYREYKVVESDGCMLDHPGFNLIWRNRTNGMTSVSLD